MNRLCQLSVCLLNARFVTVICDLIENNDLDILVITETCLSTDDSVSAGRICYQLLRPESARLRWWCRCRLYVYHRDATTWFTKFENIRIDGSTSPPNTKSGYRASELLVEFAHTMDIMAMDTSNLLVASDFNFHTDDESNNETGSFIALLKAGDRTQYVEGPTHVAGHTIDLLITRSSYAFLDNIRIHIYAHVRPLGNSLHTAPSKST